MLPALAAIVSVPVYCDAVTVGKNSVTNNATFSPARTFTVRLPPAMAAPAASRNVRVSVAAESATIATPVFVVAAGPTDTGNETERDVTVVAVLVFGENAECMKRVSTVTFPLEKIFARPAAKSPLLCVTIVVDPEAGIRNEILGSTIAAGIAWSCTPSAPSWTGLKKSTMPFTDEVDDG